MSKHFEDPSTVAFGDLNDISAPVSQKKFTKGQTSFGVALSDALRQSYTPNALIGTGIYTAIALRVMVPSSPGNDPGSWIDSQMSMLDKEKTVRPQVICRIPEIHAPLLGPSILEEDAAKADVFFVESHPLFIGEHESTLPCEPGDLVWVTFKNLNNFTGPVYLGPVFDAGTAPSLDGGDDPCADDKTKNPSSDASDKKKGKENKKKEKPVPKKPTPKKTPANKPPPVDSKKAKDQKKSGAKNPKDKPAEDPCITDVEKYSVTAAANLPPVTVVCDKRTGKKQWGAQRRMSKKKTMLLSHETGAGCGTAGYKPSRGGARNGVHFWLHRDGELLQAAPLMAICPQATYFNDISIGVEVQGPTYCKTSKMKADALNEFVLIGPNVPDHPNCIRTLDKVAHFTTGRAIAIPTLIQCEVFFNLWVALAKGTYDDKHCLKKGEVNLKIPFTIPAARGRARHSKGYASPGYFKWGPYPYGCKGGMNCMLPDSACSSAKPKTPGGNGSFWSNGTTCTQGTGEFKQQKGIVAHARFQGAYQGAISAAGGRGDGCFMEYYCLARSKYKFDARSSYQCTVGSIIYGGDFRKKFGSALTPMPSKTGKRNVHAKGAKAMKGKAYNPQGLHKSCKGKYPGIVADRMRVTTSP